MPADACRGQRMARGGRRMLCRAIADSLRWAGGYRVVNWRADGLQRADGCGAGERMARSEMADAVQGVARCCAERRQMACREPPDVVPCVQMIYGPSAGGA